MKTAHEQTEPRELAEHDHADGWYVCPICREHYRGPRGRGLAQECLDSHRREPDGAGVDLPKGHSVPVGPAGSLVRGFSGQKVLGRRKNEKRP